MKGLIGTKLGMSQLYNEKGELVPVTVIDTGPCTVLDVRTPEKHGYCAIQLGYGSKRAKNVSKAVRGHVARAGLTETPPAVIREIRLDAPSECKVGDTVGADIFAANEHVDICGRTKGRGFQGVVKRWRFGGGRATHGGGWLRRTGSIGMNVNPARVYKGRRMPGHMGDVNRTMQGLLVVAVRPDENLLLVKGSIPGANGGIVIVRSARKN